MQTDVNYDEVIGLNTETRIGWEAAALECLKRWEAAGDIAHDQIVLLAAAELARVAQREHRRSFEVVPATVSVPSVEALLGPNLRALADIFSPLARLVGDKAFIELTPDEAQRWLDTRNGFRKSVVDKNDAERELVDTFVALCEEEGAESGLDLSAQAKLTLWPLAQRALVD